LKNKTMGISKNPDRAPERETIYKDRHFKKVIQTTKEVLTRAPITGIFAFMVLVTGIGSVAGRHMGVAWHTLLFFCFILFAIQELCRILREDIPTVLEVERPSKEPSEA